MISGWKIFFRILLVIAIIGSIGLIGTNLANSELWKYNADANDEDKNKRTAGRGTFVSVVSAIVMNIIGAMMAAFGVPADLIIKNYGFFLGPVIGYILDSGVGTDEGMKALATGSGGGSFGGAVLMAGVMAAIGIGALFLLRIPGLTGVSFKGMIGTGSGMGFIGLILGLLGMKQVGEALTSGAFARYIITVLLDMFISNPLQDAMKIVMEPVTKSFQGASNFFDGFLGSNFPSILQSIVGFITFQAYTNATRFQWAYPGLDMPPENRIASGTIMLVTALAAVVYTITGDTEGLGERLIYALVAILLLYALSTFKTIDAPYQAPHTGGEEEREVMGPSGNSKYMGVAILILFSIFGMVIPFGAAGKDSPASVQVPVQTTETTKTTPVVPVVSNAPVSANEKQVKQAAKQTKQAAKQTKQAAKQATKQVKEVSAPVKAVASAAADRARQAVAAKAVKNAVKAAQKAQLAAPSKAAAAAKVAQKAQTKAVKAVQAAAPGANVAQRIAEFQAAAAAGKV